MLTGGVWGRNRNWTKKTVASWWFKPWFQAMRLKIYADHFPWRIRVKIHAGQRFPWFHHRWLWTWPYHSIPMTSLWNTKATPTSHVQSLKPNIPYIAPIQAIPRKCLENIWKTTLLLTSGYRSSTFSFCVCWHFGQTSLDVITGMGQQLWPNISHGALRSVS